MYFQAVTQSKPALVYVCHGESSTGVLQPIDGFGEICRENGALLLLDVVASLGIVPFSVDKNKVLAPAFLFARQSFIISLGRLRLCCLAKSVKLPTGPIAHYV